MYTHTHMATLFQAVNPYPKTMDIFWCHVYPLCAYCMHTIQYWTLLHIDLLVKRKFLCKKSKIDLKLAWNIEINFLVTLFLLFSVYLFEENSYLFSLKLSRNLLKITWYFGFMIIHILATCEWKCIVIKWKKSISQRPISHENTEEINCSRSTFPS